MMMKPQGLRGKKADLLESIETLGLPRGTLRDEEQGQGRMTAPLTTEDFDVAEGKT